MTDLEKLSADEILRTARRLRERIAERFPSAGLLDVADQLVELASRAHETCRELARPNWTVRIVVVGGIALLLVASIAAAVFGLTAMSSSETISWAELVQVAEAGANDLVLLGAAIYFFVSFETRFKRGKVVKALHQLRTLAHLIDAHQLTKTPEVIGHEAWRTASSPARKLSAFELGRYLDYCTEMLSLTGKIAALYGEGFGDSEALEAVNEIEALTVGLQGKIWQKLILLHAVSPGVFAGGGDAPAPHAPRSSEVVTPARVGVAPRPDAAASSTEAGATRSEVAPRDAAPSDAAPSAPSDAAASDAVASEVAASGVAASGVAASEVAASDAAASGVAASGVAASEVAASEVAASEVAASDAAPSAPSDAAPSDVAPVG
ncbi:MAG: hypothetical protein KF729_32265 [Sandaracinaceae bacterium]|nr:hypothetical protein [Sandaracinaceae bacterium]